MHLVVGDLISLRINQLTLSQSVERVACSGGRSGWGYDWEDAGDDSFAKGALDDDEKMRAELAADMERIEQEQPIRDDESEGSDALPPPATESEIAEAQEIVRRAQDDLIERNKMKAKVKEPWETELGRWLV